LEGSGGVGEGAGEPEEGREEATNSSFFLTVFLLPAFRKPSSSSLVTFELEIGFGFAATTTFAEEVVDVEGGEETLVEAAAAAALPLSMSSSFSFNN